jgi:Flp pilus assembly protein CpaB
MRRRFRYFRLSLIMTVLFVIVGAVYWATRRSPTQSAQKPDGDQIVQRYRVVVAATDLNPYTLLTPDMVQVRESETPPPPSTFTSPEEVAQRVTRTLIKAGEPIFAHQVTPPLSAGTIAPMLPVGMVGIAIPIARREQLPPVRVGDLVRIYAVFSRNKVKAVAMRAIVLSSGLANAAPSTSQQATSQQTGQPSPQSAVTESPPVLLIAVTPDEARAIALAMDSGATLYYAVLPPPPFLPQWERPLTLDELVGTPPAKPPANPPPSRRPAPSPPITVRPSPPAPLPPPNPFILRDSGKASELKPNRPAPPAIFGIVGDRPTILSVPTTEEAKGK